MNEGEVAALARRLREGVGKLARQLRAQTPSGEVTWSGVSVLGRLDRDGPATVTVLARAEGMRPQSMGAIVSALEAAGHVSAAPDPTDGRQTLWSITESCREWLRSRRAVREDWLHDRLRAKLSADELEILAQAAAFIDRLAET